MSTQRDNDNDNGTTNWNNNTIPSRNPAQTLWKMSLEEWDAFLDGEVSAAELKQRHADDGGDDQ
jgi:hypothetical protein